MKGNRDFRQARPCIVRLSTRKPDERGSKSWGQRCCTTYCMLPLRAATNNMVYARTFGVSALRCICIVSSTEAAEAQGESSFAAFKRYTRYSMNNKPAAAFVRLSALLKIWNFSPSRGISVSNTLLLEKEQKIVEIQ